MNSRNLDARGTYFAAIEPRTSGAGFFDPACMEFYQRRLLYCHGAYQIRLHAYLLMEKQIFLLFTPYTASSFQSLTKFLNRCYNDYYMIRFDRRTHVWRSAATISRIWRTELIRDCQKFIERYALNIPCIRHPGQYAYSSYCMNAFELRPSLLSRHRAISDFLSQRQWALGSYRRFIATPFRPECEHALSRRLLGDGKMVTDSSKTSRKAGL